MGAIEASKTGAGDTETRTAGYGAAVDDAAPPASLSDSAIVDRGAVVDSGVDDDEAKEEEDTEAGDADKEDAGSGASSSHASAIVPTSVHRLAANAAGG
jgi:hypothetical protein